MDKFLAEDIYYTLCGEMQKGAGVPGIEDAFAEGACCDVAYNRMMEARENLFRRLGVEEDEDIERILLEGMSITRYLCLKMYEYGTMEKEFLRNNKEI